MEESMPLFLRISLKKWFHRGQNRHFRHVTDKIEASDCEKATEFSVPETTKSWEITEQKE